MLAMGVIGKKITGGGGAKPNTPPKPSGKCSSDADCDATRVCKPSTSRCVLRAGVAGKAVLAARGARVVPVPVPKPLPKPITPKRSSVVKCTPATSNADCDALRICNPLTERCVLRTGPAGRRAIAQARGGGGGGSGGASKKPNINRGPARTVLTRADTKALKHWAFHFIYAIGQQRPPRNDGIVDWRSLYDIPGAPWAKVFYWFLSGDPRADADVRAMMAALERDRLAHKTPNVVVTAAVLLNIVRNYVVKELGARTWKAIEDAKGRVLNNIHAPKHQVAGRPMAKQIQRVARAASPDPASKTKLQCADLVTVPQSPTRGTCWFNAMLMVFLFSDGMRHETKRALHAYASKMQNGTTTVNRRVNDVLQRIVSLLLLYKQPRAARNAIYDKAFEHGIRPEDILRSIHALNPLAFKTKSPRRGHAPLDAANVVRGIRGYFPIEAAPVMLQLLGMDAVMYTATQAYRDGSRVHLTQVWSHAEDASRPDVRVVMVCSGDQRLVEEMLHDGRGGWARGETITVPTTARSAGLLDTVVIGTNTYDLDSTIMASYNRTEGVQGGHAVAGIACNGSKMYYNGWSFQNRPCPLIDVDWTRRGIYLATSGRQELRGTDVCYTTARKSASDLSFDGSSATQDQIRFYVRRE